jgi:hypothetical protein
MAKTPKDPRDGTERPGAAILTDPVDVFSLPAPDPITALRIVGTDLPEIPLPPSKLTFTLGSAPSPREVDIRLSSKMLHGLDYDRDHISTFHLVMQRKGSKLRVLDHGSTNGTHYRESRETDFFVVAGETFRPGDVPLLALNEPLRSLRTELLWWLGLEAHATIDRAIHETIATDEPIALLGPVDCEPLLLAEWIHKTSRRRDSAFVPVGPPLATREAQKAKLDHAEGGSIFLDVREFDALPAFFVRGLFESKKIRPIIAAPDLARAADRLGDQRLRAIEIPKLADRAADVPGLLDILFRRAGSSHTIAELNQLGGEDNTAALVAHKWPGNFVELRKAAPKLLAVIEHGGPRPASRALGQKSHSSLSTWLKRLGIRVRSDDE